MYEQSLQSINYVFTSAHLHCQCAGLLYPYLEHVSNVLKDFLDIPYVPFFRGSQGDLLFKSLIFVNPNLKNLPIASNSSGDSNDNYIPNPHSPWFKGPGQPDCFPLRSMTFLFHLLSIVKIYVLLRVPGKYQLILISGWF